MKANKTSQLYLRVLGYQESDGSWAAHCLETDLVGYGKNFNKALENLIELTEMQIGFAHYKKQPSLLDRQAPIGIIETYNSLMRQRLQSLTKSSKSKPSHTITSFPLPIDLPKSGYNFVSA